ncbi:MAG: UPF0182 family protein [Streptosporangiales bacterium]
MAFAKAANMPRGGRVGRRVLIGIGILVALIIIALVFTNVWVNVLWYGSVGYGGVYGTVVWTELALFGCGAVLLGGVVALTFAIARRLRPLVVPNTPDQQVLARYRESLEPFLRIVGGVIAGLVGLIGGLTAVGSWKTVLGFVHRTPFGKTDPQFGLDVGFYVFTYPFLRLLLAYGFAAVVLAFFAAAGVHYLYGGLRFAPRGHRRVSDAARAHLAILLGIFVLLKAAAYWLDRYGLVFSGRSDIFTGASYTDVHAVLPAKTILAAIALICAVLFFASAVRKGLLLAGVSLGLLIVSAIIIGGLYPAAVQRFQVTPSEQSKEAPYIKRNIESTRGAYAIDNVDVQAYNAKVKPSERQGISANDVSHIRLVDPSVVSATFQQLQQIRSFYSFPQALDIDRYTINGQEGTSIVAARELPHPPSDRDNWVTRHLVYTHGFGFVAAEGNKVRPDGKPVWEESNIPPQGELGDFQPRIYYGEKSPAYSIVGAPKGTSPTEFDYASGRKTGQTNTTYEGNGGVDLRSFFHRLLYAVHFSDINLLLSDQINSESQILYDRGPRERVQKAAPYLELDGDPYPAIVGGRMVWIVDGYTQTNMYPYSERKSFAEATQDSLTSNAAHTAQPGEQVNYIRNSVKATVDAYSGKVTLYAWDPDDPLLKTWQKVFPGTVQPASQMSEEMRAHVRYPADLFKAQRTMLAKYHVQNPQAFYGSQDFWSVPDDPTKPDSKAPQPPYYMYVQMPGEGQYQFSLTSTLVPKKRPNLAAFMAVSSDPGPDYGKIRLLRLPRDTAVPGPGTIQGNFESYAPATTQLSLLRNGGASITFGNLLTLPYAGGLLYVEPVYVKAKSGESYPLLQKVLVSFGSKIGYADTLEEALGQVFGKSNQPQQDKNQNGGGGEGGGSQDGSGVRAQLSKAISDAQDAYADGQKALKQGDFKAYGDAQKRLKSALDRAAKLRKQLGTSATPGPSPSGGSSPSAGASTPASKVTTPAPSGSP